jgi:predicted membrane metal-binding protein
MRRNPLVIDLAIAVLCALVVLIVSPGVAVDAIIALIVLAVCGLGFAVSRRRRRGHRSIPGYAVGRDVPRRSRRPRP